MYFETLIIPVMIFPAINWWKWMYKISPYTYIIESLLGQAIGGDSIECSLSLSTIEWLDAWQLNGSFIESAGGYLANPEATERYQLYFAKTADQFMYSRFNIKYSNHWRNLGIVFGYVAFNVVAVFWFTYFMRIRTVSVFASLRQNLTCHK
ncbi:hypothetical protein BDR06DRAFT_994992 [Suillus hirtellus]|nr:hypothetical protein BDR06DRAFT_994992 [Suillus hirtellus]